MNKHQYFVTGTDTGVGKTKISCALIQAANRLGLSTAGIKPIASGCVMIDGQWCNDDALALQQAANYPLAYAQVNPIALPQAIAPHFAATLNSITLSVNPLVQHCRQLQTLPIQFTVIEGAGGWLVPLNDRESLADVVAVLSIPVILVVGIRLGCINHALLTVQAINDKKLPLAAWVANCVDANTEMRDEIIASLNSRIAAPCLGVVPFTEQADVSEFIDLRVITVP